MVNAQRFRARKVDLKRPLPVYRAADLDDLDEDDNRQVDAIETGVEKDEETEHHLQAAISATHAAASGNAPAKQVYIPTPDASKTIDGYNALYPKNFTCPTSLIRSSETVEECCSPVYCLDDTDIEWLKTYNEKKQAVDPELSEDELENAMDQLESLTRDMVFLRSEDIPSIDYLASHAADRDRPFAQHTIRLVFEHWKQRRIVRGFKTVTASLQYEDTSKAAVEIDPYVCFRRREVRQGRKTRRADQRSLEQLRRLRVNLAMASQMLDLCVERESVKIQLVEDAQELARHRATVLRMRRRLGVAGNAGVDDLFVPPVQQRKRLSARDQSQQRARGGVRKPRIATGLASAAAAAAAAAAAGGGASGSSNGMGSVGPNGSLMGSGAYADPIIPLPFVLPQTVTVHPYPVPRWQQEMAERIRAKTQKHEAMLSSGGFVDATYAGNQQSSQYRLHTNSSIDPRMSSFWAPSLVGQQQQQQWVSAEPTASTMPLHRSLSQSQSLAFRVRCGRNGRMYLDRRTVNPGCQVSSARMQQYRLSLLRPEDHLRLAQLHKRFDSSVSVSSSSSPSFPSSLPSIPDDLLKPFSFSHELLAPPSPPPNEPPPNQQQQMSKLTIPSLPRSMDDGENAGLPGTSSSGSGSGFMSPDTLEMMLPRVANNGNGASSSSSVLHHHHQQIASPPLSASSVSLTDISATPTSTRQSVVKQSAALATGSGGAGSSSNNTAASAQSSPMPTGASSSNGIGNGSSGGETGPPVMAKSSSPTAAHHHHLNHQHQQQQHSPSSSSSISSVMAAGMPINMPALVSAVSTPSLSSLSPQMGGNHHGSPAIAASNTAAKCN
ncbi:Enhancer of polycomb-like protein 1 [Coemansia sp. RSA 1200]|nr:Enhancer of polycomb-like protein 1 [Coemansia sp. RSA 1200]